MSDYKEFTGKNLDEAISAACDHFQLERGKLEIEILSGGSSGIFGLVGKRKAVVKAKPRGTPSLPLRERPETPRASEPQAEAVPTPAVQEPTTAAEAAPRGEPRDPRPAKENREPRESREPREQRQRQPRGEPREDNRRQGRNDRDEPRGEAQAEKQESREPRPERSDRGERGGDGRGESRKPRPDRGERRDQPRPKPAPALARVETDVEGFDEDDDASAPVEGGVPLENQELAQLLDEAVKTLITPIVGPATFELLQASDRIKVVIRDEEQAGILIGREGQTLNALQYLLNRIVAKKWPESLKVQVDAGSYRQRQDEKLRQLAMYLADKVLHSGKPQSTKPLSSYHRRVIHMTLQNHEAVQTRSKGDGPMKRVLVLPKRDKGGNGREPRGD